MMASQLITDLERRRVQLWTEGDNLRVRAPKGVLTPELQLRLAACKPGLLALLKRQGGEAGESLRRRIVHDPVHRYEPFPLTDIQQAYWIGRNSGIELGNVACHAYYEVDARKLDLTRFNLALNRLIRRHDMLRAIVLPDGRQQVLQGVPDYRIEVVDLRGRAAGEASIALEAVRQRMSHQVLPADRWPLFEICASRLGDDRVRLHFSFDIIIADVWSLQILFREWFQLYRDMDSPLAHLDVQFRDYVVAVAGLEESEFYSLSRQYWSDRLATLPPAPELPLAVSPSTILSPRFVRRRERIERDAWTRIKERCATSGVTPSGVLLAAFSEVLRAWSKSPNFTINVTVLNRVPLHPQVNDIIGDFTSLLPLAVESSPDAPFQVRAACIQAQLLEDMEHRFGGGVWIFRDLARQQGRAPGAAMPIVFTSLLTHNAAASEISQALWMGEVVHGITQTPQVWLDHQVMEENGALVFNWDAVEALFPAGMLQDMFDSYCSLLRRLEEERTWREPVTDLLPPGQAQQRALVNQTGITASHATLHRLFQDRASQLPQQAAVITTMGRLTYEQLDRKTDQLGRKLAGMGARPNSLVAVVMEKGWEQVVGVISIIKSGAAYLPLDPSLPRERLWHLLERADVTIALTQSWIEGRIEWPDAVERLAVDAERFPAETDALPPDGSGKAEDLAYVIYTSGSTGSPKGVMINHIGAVNTLLDVNRRFDVGVGDRILAVSSLGFDLSVYDIFGTLAAGGTIVMPDARVIRDPAHWVELIRRHNVTVWNSAPALMEMLVTHALSTATSLGDSLRLVLLSGDWIPVTLPDRIRQVAPQAEIVSLGGATEASIWSILYPIREVPEESGSIPYGRPMANQRLYVLDHASEPRPTWVPGDIHIAGMGLALGYWKDEALTDVSFINHPRTGERLYRTGDLGRYLPDGNIEFLGREDSQVKILGYRIELGEIESALGQHPRVRSAAVVARGSSERRRLIAYVVAERSSAPSADELRDFLASKLPRYMVPHTFVTIDSLPLTANGKVDRRALPEPSTSAAPAVRGGAEGLRPFDQQIAACVARVLKLDLDRVPFDASLLDLGANSIDLVRIAAAFEREFGVRPGMEEFYSNPTLNGLLRSFFQQRIPLGGEGAKRTSIRAPGRAPKVQPARCEEGEL